MNNSLQNNACPIVLKNERGTIMLFVTLLAGVICAFLAFAVDVSRMSDAKTEKILGAEQSALSALQEYLSYGVPDATCPIGPSQPQCKHTQKFIKAKQNAATTGSWNIQTFLGAAHISNVSEFDASAGVDRKGEIQSGRWWTTIPTSCSIAGCPCSGPVPCFQVCPDGAPGCEAISGAAAPDKGYASAMRVTYYTSVNSKLPLLFGAMIGQPNVAVSYAATAASAPTVATILPKFSVVLVDLGRNMTVDSHLPFEKIPTAGADRANPTVGPDPATPTNRRREFAYNVASCPAGAVSTVLPSANDISATVANNAFQNNWASVAASIKSDYACVTNPEADSYMVDTVTPAEPLRTSLETVHAFLEQYASDASPQDQICPVFYDHGIRNVGLTKPCFDKTDANFEKLLKMTSMAAADLADTTDACASGVGTCKNMYRAGVFPRMGSFSDLPRAMDFAFNIIKSTSNLWLNENNVFVFSNGLTNCTMYPGVNCRSYLPAGSMASTALQDEYYGAHKMSLHQFLYDKVGGIFKTNKIKVHTYLIGRSVMPHTALIQNGSGTACKTELESRSRRYLQSLRFPPGDDDALPDGSGDTFRAASDDYDKWLLFVYHSLGIDIIPPYFGDQTRLDATQLLTAVPATFPLKTYYYPSPNSHFSTAAGLTRGMWRPIRPLCPATPWPGGGPQTPDEICVLPPKATPPALLANEFDTEQYVTDIMADASGPSLVGAGIVDPNGRLICDPTILAPVGENLATWSTKIAATEFLSVRPLTLVRQP